MKYKLQFLWDVEEEKWCDFYSFMSLFGKFPESFETEKEAQDVENELKSELPAIAGKSRIVTFVPRDEL